MSIEMRGYMDNFNKKLNENKSEKPINNNEELINKIEDLIHGTVILRDVPYSMEDGSKELDPSSVTEAAKFILELLKKGDSNIENINDKSFKIGDKFMDINSKTDDIFTVSKVDQDGVYDEYGWYRLFKNCIKITQ